MPLLISGVAAKPNRHTSEIVVDTGQPIAEFRASEAFGVDTDGGAREDAGPLFLKENRASLRSLSGFRFSYRLRTELGIEAWHWSSQGKWSDVRNHEGYWTSIAPKAPERISYGYRLPRRGDTNDEANNDGYSRIDDGDPTTFWKSNPYLDGRYTGRGGDHEEWVVVELPRSTLVNAIRIGWAKPFASQFKVQFWAGQDEYSGHWRDFANSSETDGTGGEETRRLAPTARPVRFVRILLQRSSHTSLSGSTDPRDAVGYAIAELSLGVIDAHGMFHDVIRHAAFHSAQTVIHVSSTDPWHRATDRDPDTAQPSLIEMRRHGLIGLAPLMVPVGVLYDTPENMLGLVRYLMSEHLPITRLELGEEPDGQLVSAEDYGALYLEFATLFRREFPQLELGGPSLVNGVSNSWLTDDPDQSWTSHLIKYLRGRTALDQLDFFSFEYFPFDDVCGTVALKLREQSDMMSTLFDRLKSDGVPSDIPWLITEYGYSAFGGEPLVQMPSALLQADVIGDFLSRGGSTFFLYGAAPSWPIAGEKRCAGQGNLMLWAADRQGRARWPMPQLHAYRMIVDHWAAPGEEINQLYRTRSTLRDPQGRPLVKTYALRRSDGRWSMMLVNRSAQPVSVRIKLAPDSDGRHGLDVWQYSERQYLWPQVSLKTWPTRSLAPARSVLASWSRQMKLPPISLTVIADRPAKSALHL